MSKPAPSGFLPERTIHLHPSKYCNLRCRHCYSASSSDEDRIGLDTDALYEPLALLRQEGYERVSISGGEPLLYPQIHALVRSLKALGYRISLVTNGSPVGPRTLETLECVDTVAISLDGDRVTHNNTRANGRSFDWALRALDFLAAKARRAAIAFCVSRASLFDLPQVASLALEHGAAVLQLRPVALAGRARGSNIDALTDADANRLFLMALVLKQELAGSLPIQLDLVHSNEIHAHREQYESLLDAAGRADRPLSDLVNPLVILETGILRPMTYEFPPDYDIGRVRDLTSESVHAYKRSRVGGFAELVASALEAAYGEDRLLDWFTFCSEYAGHGGRTTRRAA